jgi:hypothetical protein
MDFAWRWIMPILDRPIESQWYRHLDRDYLFQVTAVDEEAGTVELQRFDGDLEEIALEEWYALGVEPVEPPEDWTGPMDNVGHDDLGYSDSGTTGGSGEHPLQEAGLPGGPALPEFEGEEEG